MTLALFSGVGNIIYPPCVGRLTGGDYLISSGGFAVSGVLLAMLAVLALANKDGDPLRVCAPLGKYGGTALAASFYLFLGVFSPARARQRSPVKWASVICPACTALIVLSLLRVPEKMLALPVWSGRAYFLALMLRFCCHAALDFLFLISSRSQRFLWPGYFCGRRGTDRLHPATF